MHKKLPPISGKLPVFMHGADYNPDQWLHDPKVLEEDIRLMKLANCNVMAVGIFSWSSLEPEEGTFTFEWLDRVLDTFVENGIYAWLATPSGARPAWMSQKYPEVLRVQKNRVRNLHGFRHNHCFTSPAYREKVTIMNGKLAERYAFHPAVVGWHISNEFGGDCHCNYCQDAFRAWLKRQYGTLDALNLAWWTTFWSHRYTDWAQVESPAPHGETQVHGQNLDWKRFVTDQTIDFYKHEIAPLKAANAELLCTTNMMYMFYDLDYRKFADVVDVVSWDAYPTWHEADSDAGVASSFAFNHDLFRTLKQKPFMLMESTPSLTNWQPVSKLKRPGMHRLSSLQAVAHGSDTVQYFQWRKSRGSSEKFHGAVVDHVGHEHTRVFRDVASLGGTLSKLTELIGTTVPAEAAILFDWDNWWAVNDAQGPRNGGLHYEKTVMQHYRALWELGVPTDIIGSDDDLSTYKLLVVPMAYLLREDAGARIERFVRGGGTIAVTYWSGIVNENDLCYLTGFPGPLRKTLGIWAEEIEGLHDHDRNGIVLQAGNPLGLEGAFDVHELCELIHSEGADVLAVYQDDFYAGRPALTVNALDQGKAYFLAARVSEPSFYDSFYGKLVTDAGVRRAIEAELPHGVTAQLRTDGEQDYVFILNFSGTGATVKLDEQCYTDVESGEAVTGSVSLPLYGLRILKRKA
ncbi:beta-galactosidase [Paenibacillus darwinianus]|uniref:Beta-galactosidase n=1 Tax=Paenibacillus darwinianus TaxID=1380763 RepID=A0A9W5S2V2_9BACL|nr:beta-galactosidase [Paenibacillus darwinianus]EXX90401.1 beta-galactosidase [Paenibacillus darwinianus]EXX91079.1 beta-galactosidase [Paenibacillus darwinianus]EXX91979.1 beta-galactosidase [Paenibacillus darwinianus]